VQSFIALQVSTLLFSIIVNQEKIADLSSELIFQSEEKPLNENIFLFLFYEREVSRINHPNKSQQVLHHKNQIKMVEKEHNLINSPNDHEYVVLTDQINFK
jgi:hypothetical protein